MMAGNIKNYRRGRSTSTSNQVIVDLNDIDNRKKASTLVGRKAVWTTSSGKRLVGKVMSAHGNKGAVRVRFEKGVPTIALGERILIQ